MTDRSVESSEPQCDVSGLCVWTIELKGLDISTILGTIVGPPG